MADKKELKRLFYIVERVLDKKNISKIMKVKDLDERKHLFEHAIKKELELRPLHFRNKINKMHKDKETFFIRTKINLLKLKISYFVIDFQKKEFIKLVKLIKQIENDIKNV